MKTLHTLILALLISPLFSLYASTLFDVERANVWIDNGANSRSYYIPQWSENANILNNAITVGPTLSIATKLENVNVLVNKTPTSYPAYTPLTPLPNISLVGLDYADLLGGSLQTPILLIKPDGGTFNNTIEVVFELKGAENDTLIYTLNGEDQTPVEINANDTNNTFSLFLSKNAEHIIQYRLQSETIFQSAIFNIINSDTKRDSDGDGIPDSVEIELGMNPLLTTQATDEWNPFEKLLRNNNLDDSDGDGWSDFDEIELRGTDADDNHSKPTVNSLYGVEYKFKTDSELESVYRVSFLDLLSTSLYDSSKLQDINLSSEYYNVAISSLTNGELNSSLEAGYVPRVRISAKVPIVERVRVTDDNNTKVYKNFIASSKDLSVKTYYEIFKDSAITEFTASSFISSYIEYLKENLVVDRSVSLSDTNSIDVSILEAALRTRVESQTMLFLGNPNFTSSYEAYVNTKNALAQRERSFDDLFLDLQQLLSTYPLETPGLEDVMLLETNTTEVNLASFMQNSLDVSDTYRISLMSIVDFTTADLNISVLSSKVDTDEDTLLNKEEVLAVVYSDPLLGDSDGDGMGDALDPCVNDIRNSCMNDPISNEDSDHDGVVDSADNCPFDADSSQEDKDGDGIGDICAKKGLVLTTPRTNIQLFQDASFTFKVTKTKSSSNTISWFINEEKDELATQEEFVHTFRKIGEHLVCASLIATLSKESPCVKVTILEKNALSNSFSLYTRSVIETDSGTKNALVELALAKPSTKSKIYDFETRDDSALVNSDYIQTAGTLTFNVGEQRKYISIPIVGDTIHETEELFSLWIYPTTKEEKSNKINIHIFDNDAAPDDNGTEPPVTTVAQNNIFFEFQTEEYGSEPWMSDGSETNTTLLKNIELDENSSYPRNFTKVGSDKVFFTASNTDGATSLYVSDGTSDETHSLGLLAGYEPSNFIDVNGTLYFTLLDAADNIKKLYKSDGESFNLITSLARGYESTSMGNYFTLVGNDLYFSSDILSVDEYDNELHKFDTQTETIALVKDIVVGADSSSPSMFTKVDESLYFVTQYRNIYTTDGTEAGTTLVTSLDENSSIYHVEYIDGSLYYTVNDYNLGTLDVVSLNLASTTQTTHLHYEDGTNVGLSFKLGDTYYITTSLDSEYKIISILGELVTEEFISDKYIYQAKTLDDRFYFTDSEGLTCSSDYSTIMKTTVDGEYITFIEGSLNNELYFKVADKSTHSLYKADATTTTLLVDDGSAAP